MTREELETLAKNGESVTLEFKASTVNLKAALETLCAFLNGKGGTVLIGVKDNGQLIGQEITDNTKREIAREIKKIEPAASITIHYILVTKNKYALVFQTHPGEHCPYIYDGRAFQRNESQTERMSQHRYEQLLVKRGQLNHTWEEMFADDYDLSDLDQEEIYKTISDGIRENRIPASAQKDNVSQILERLNLCAEGKLKRAAIVLYAKEKSMKFVQCMIKMARFEGIDKLGNFIDNQQFHGNAFKLLEEADAFLRRHLPIASFYKPDQFKRIDKPTLPVMAIREALINALCHRDYSNRATDISLAIFNNRLEIWNSGLLLPELTIENLKHKHSSILRNKLIANVFYVRGMIEKWGIGTTRMVTLCKEEHIPEPEFSEHTGGLEVIFKFRESISHTTNLTLSSEQLTSRQNEILRIFRNYSVLTTQQLMKELINPPSQRMIQKDLKVLKVKGLVNLIGTGKNTRWALNNNN